MIVVLALAALLAGAAVTFAQEGRSTWVKVLLVALSLAIFLGLAALGWAVNDEYLKVTVAYVFGVIVLPIVERITAFATRRGAHSQD